MSRTTRNHRLPTRPLLGGLSLLVLATLVVAQSGVHGAALAQSRGQQAVIAGQPNAAPAPERRVERHHQRVIPASVAAGALPAPRRPVIVPPEPPATRLPGVIGHVLVGWLDLPPPRR